MCDQWKNNFLSFREWSIANGYDKKLTIDRIDNNKGYSPENCRWSTMKQQANNRRNSHFITYNGEKRTISEWERHLNMNEGVLRNRIFSGWSPERAINTPVRHIKMG